MDTPKPLSSEYFDDWYAAMTVSPVKDEIMQRHLGLPPLVLSSGTLPGAGLDDVVAALQASPGDHVVDLACGRGGYTLEVARRTGARVTGIDFSAEAVRQAGELSRASGTRAEFRVGTFDATGLGDACADALMCLDSIQFTDDAVAAFAELRRVLRPGGRAVLTTWEAADPYDDVLPPRLLAVHLGAWLATAGFVDVEVVDRPDWHETELAMWREASELDPGDDAALQSFRAEGLRTFTRPDALRRVIATATRPVD